VAPRSFDSKINGIIDNIGANNAGFYGGGGEQIVNNVCGNKTSKTYNASINNMSSYSANGITIYVYPACAPVTNYAIYSSIAPIMLSMDSSIIDRAFASAGGPNPKSFSGYYCIDSTGANITRADGWIPGYSGNGPFYSTINVIDGKCH